MFGFLFPSLDQSVESYSMQQGRLLLNAPQARDAIGSIATHYIAPLYTDKASIDGTGQLWMKVTTQ